MPIPFIDLRRLEPDFLEAWSEKLLKLSKNAQFIGGVEVETFEKNLSQNNHSPFAISCANGTDALQLALRSSGIGPGDSVLLPDFTFWATFEAIVNVGATPITVDIHPDDLQMDYDLFCEGIETFQPKAGILVHLYGWGSKQLDKFRAFNQRDDFILIEDGAQAYGTLYQNQPIFQEAKLATLSFYPTKVLGGAGDGGAVLSSQEDLAKKARTLANHGRSGHYSHSSAGWNSRLDTLQAAYLNLVSQHIDQRIESRRHYATAYQKAFTSTEKIKCLRPPQDIQENGYLNVLYLSPEFRPQCIKALHKEQIGYGIAYPQSISDQEGAKPYLQDKIGGEVAKRTAQSVLNLPLFPYLQENEFEKIVSTLSLL